MISWVIRFHCCLQYLLSIFYGLYSSTSCCKSQQPVMGKGKIQPPVAPKLLNRFWWNLELPSLYSRYDHTCKSVWCCDNAGGLGEHVSCHMFWFLSRPFSLFLGSCYSSVSRPILTTCASYDVFPHKDVPFGGLIVATPHLEDEITSKPQLWWRK